MKRIALLLAGAAAVMAAEALLLGVTWHITYGHGLYCVLGVASTVGCDAQPASVAGRLAAVVVILTCIPLLAAVFAWLTGHHASKQVASQVHERVSAIEKRIAEEADRRHVIMQRHIERVVAGHCADAMQHVSVVADGPARGGAGSNPAKSEGLNAEKAAPAPGAAGPAVPPSATTTPRPAAKTRNQPRRM
jgi:hypothetical protein